MWTSCQQNEVPNIAQAKKYPEVPTFWRLFYRPKMAEISNLLSHFNAICHNICHKACWRLQSVYPGFQRLFMRGFRFRSCLKVTRAKASGPERHPFDSPEPVRTPLIPKHPESGCFADWFLGDIECFICSDWITITIGACSGRGWLIACVASVSNRVIARKFLLSPPPPPSFLFFFLPPSQLSRLTRAETLATQASWLKVTD